MKLIWKIFRSWGTPAFHLSRICPTYVTFFSTSGKKCTGVGFFRSADLMFLFETISCNVIRQCNFWICCFAPASAGQTSISISSNSFKTGKKKLKTGEKTSCLKRKQRVRYGEIDRERERQRERKQRED